MAVKTLDAPASTYVTGHCGNGNHENSKNLSAGGSLLPACRGKYEYRFVTVQCSCWCHEMFAMIAPELADPLSPGSDTLHGNGSPGSVAYEPLEHVTTATGTGHAAPNVQGKKTFWQLVVENEGVEDQLRRMVASMFGLPEPDLSADAEERSRRKRGSMDTNVEIVCKLWLESKLVFDQLTPNVIALLISALNPPSEGAVYATLTRWEEHGLCKTEKKPFRFVCFSPSVGEHGIAAVIKSNARERDARSKGFF